MGHRCACSGSMCLISRERLAARSDPWQSRRILRKLAVFRQLTRTFPMTGFGIIGCGMISRFHAKAVADIKDAKVTACFDSFTASADNFGAEIGCTVCHDLDKLLADKNGDVVTICTPSGVPMEPAIAAAKAGKHVIVEKPLDITLKRCDAMITACDKAGVVLSTIFPSRFHESSQLLKGAIDKGRFGKLTMGDAYVKWFRTQEYYDSGAWRGTWALDGGGALMNQA